MDVDPASRRDLCASVAELFENVRRHARADAVRLQASRCGDTVEILVVDDGAGFDADRPAMAVENGHFGLVGVRERVGALGGQVTWELVVGSGTQVSISVPCGRPRGEVAS